MTDKLLKRLRSAVVLTALVWVAALVFAPTANATEGQEPEVTCPTFLLRGATGAYPEVDFGDAPAGSSVVDADTVVLTKPAEGEQPGVEFAAFDLDITATGDITVDFETTDDDAGDGVAVTDAGAVRLFFYAEQGADTLNDAPAGFVAASGASGTLTLPVDGHVGTLGLVYDASNPSAGTVTFSNLEIDGQPVSFLAEACASPSPSASASAAPSSAVPSPAASSPAARDLPVTGAPVRMAFGVGGGILIAGIAMYALARVRRRFEA